MNQRTAVRLEAVRQNVDRVGIDKGADFSFVNRVGKREVPADWADNLRL